MTSITFGGGPTIEARRNFSNLKNGAQVPGYGGYIHQIKYHNGHTYGDQTHILLNNRNFTGSANFEEYRKVNGDYVPRNVLPKSTGGNKLTESMVSGYTGYIPSRKFHFSNNYRVECDECIDDFVLAKSNKLNKDKEIVGQVLNAKKHTNISNEAEVKKELDNFKDSNFKYRILRGDKRETTEPPIPGYTGFIPRIAATDLGLGATYHNTTLKGLTDFKNNFLYNNSNPRYQLQGSQSAKPATRKVLYDPSGMIPKYTGYVHGKKFQFGNTYGNTTRLLPVCSHTYNSFSDYMTENAPRTELC